MHQVRKRTELTGESELITITLPSLQNAVTTQPSLLPFRLFHAQVVIIIAQNVLHQVRLSWERWGVGILIDWFVNLRTLFPLHIDQCRATENYVSVQITAVLTSDVVLLGNNASTPLAVRNVFGAQTKVAGPSTPLQLHYDTPESPSQPSTAHHLRRYKTLDDMEYPSGIASFAMRPTSVFKAGYCYITLSY